MENKIKVGSKVIGNWGAMLSRSYGKVIKIEDGLVHVKWEDDYMDNSVEEVEKFKFGPVGEIGLYIKEEKLSGIKVEGHFGKWYEIDRTERNGKTYILLESELYGDEVEALIIDEDMNLIKDDIWNGFDDLDE